MGRFELTCIFLAHISGTEFQLEWKSAIVLRSVFFMVLDSSKWQMKYPSLFCEETASWTETIYLCVWFGIPFPATHNCSYLSQQIVYDWYRHVLFDSYLCRDLKIKKVWLWNNIDGMQCCFSWMCAVWVWDKKCLIWDEQCTSLLPDINLRCRHISYTHILYTPPICYIWSILMKKEHRAIIF